MTTVLVTLALGLIFGGLWAYAIWARDNADRAADRVERRADNSAWFRSLNGGDK